MEKLGKVITTVMQELLREQAKQRYFQVPAPERDGFVSWVCNCRVEAGKEGQPAQDNYDADSMETLVWIIRQAKETGGFTPFEQHLLNCDVLVALTLIDFCFEMGS